MMQIRNLILVLGDQLDLDAPIIQSIDGMMWSGWQRSMRNRKRFGRINKELFIFIGDAAFCGSLRDRGISVDYRELDAVGVRLFPLH